jgi:citrate lyase subunit beta/citryl-CoA lyase
MERDTVQARRLGFTAKSTFNPRQVEVINRVFSPRPDEIAYARLVVDAFGAAEARGDASVAVGGQLVDRPIVLRAQRLLELAGGGLAKTRLAKTRLATTGLAGDGQGGR